MADPSENADSTPEVVDVSEDGAAPLVLDPSVSAAVSNPGTLIRIGRMVQSMLEEVRQVPLDEAGRKRLSEIHERALTAVREVVSEDLREELSQLALPFGEGVPTESELRIAQAQLLGWLDGLFRGIQAAVFNQQMLAQRQLQELQQGRPGGQYL